MCALLSVWTVFAGSIVLRVLPIEAVAALLIERGARGPGVGHPAQAPRDARDAPELLAAAMAALARRDPNLVRVLPTRLSMKLTTWVAMHEGLRNSPRCKAAFDALVKGLRRYVK